LGLWESAEFVEKEFQKIGVSTKTHLKYLDENTLSTTGLKIISRKIIVHAIKDEFYPENQSSRIPSSPIQNLEKITVNVMKLVNEIKFL
jgi:hypothetical protein